MEQDAASSAANVAECENAQPEVRDGGGTREKQVAEVWNAQLKGGGGGLDTVKDASQLFLDGNASG